MKNVLFEGVVNIKKFYLLVLISVLFISMSIVSAENITDSQDDDTDNYIITETTKNNSEIITKKTTGNVTKTGTNQTNKVASKTSVNSLSIKYNTTTNLTAKITNAKTDADINTGKVVFKINGVTVGYSNVKNGIASYIYQNKLNPKNYTITAKYGENSNFLESSANSTLTILKDESRVIVKNATVISNNTVKLTALVTDKISGNNATSGKLAFKINGKTVGYANVSKGIAILSYKTDKLSAKTYIINASYGGNNMLYSSASSRSYLNVSPIPTKMTVNNITGYSTSVTLKATIVNAISYTYLPSGTVVFKINDKTVGNSTIKNGKVSFTYSTTNLARGKYKISAILKPTSFYASSNATGNLTILAETYFTYSQIKSAAVTVRTNLEANKIVNTVNIGKSKISLSDFLALMIQATENVNNGKSSEKIPFIQYKTITEQYDTLTAGILNISQILDIGNRTLNFMKINNKPPRYANTIFGQMGYYNIIYSYSKVLDVSTSTWLPSTCKVYNWATIHPSNSKKRTIYITSDIIFNSNKDYAFMNSIKIALEAKGYKAIVNGYGPNSHNVAIWNQSLPANAVQLSIFGGADAGVIYDMCTRTFMRLKENRLIFIAYDPTHSKDITGLSFLERAHDDNYSSSDFTGLNNPDIYLKNHGYDYVYSNSVNTIVNKLIDYIS